MKVNFRESVGKAFLCQVQLSPEDVDKKVIDMKECFVDCKEILLVSSLSGVNSSLSWGKTKIFFEDGFKEMELLVLLVWGKRMDAQRVDVM